MIVKLMDRFTALVISHNYCLLRGLDLLLGAGYRDDALITAARGLVDGDGGAGVAPDLPHPLSPGPDDGPRQLVRDGHLRALYCTVLYCTVYCTVLY